MAKTCFSCSHWANEEAISYEGCGDMAPCLKLSGKHNPSQPSTKLYSHHQRGLSGPAQAISTRHDFFCKFHSDK